MSHIIEEYSKNLGVKISKPIVNKHFFPILHDKYIIIYGDDSIQSKTYSYYDIVLELIRPVLNQFDIKVIQLKGSSIIRGVNNILDVAFKNEAYLISKSLLYIGPDNYLSQYASSQGVKTITLHGNCYANNTKPFWGNNLNSICMEPEWKVKPSYQIQDPEKQIDNIKPEKIAENIFKILNYKCLLNFHTKHIGQFFKNDVIEVVPTKIIRGLPKQIYLRIDYGFEESAFLYYCQNHEVTIISDRFIQPQGIQQFKNNIKKIMILVDKTATDIPHKFFELMNSWGINITLLCKNKEDIGFLRNLYFDTDIQLFNIEKEKIQVSNKAKFLSNKKIIEGDKTYFSKAHYQKRLDSNLNVLDTPEYWEELEYFYIYER